MITSCEKREDPKRALELIDAMHAQGLKPGTTTCNALISTCGKAKEAERALQLLNEMPRQGLKPDIITYSAMTSACETGLEDAGRARGLFDGMRR